MPPKRPAVHVAGADADNAEGGGLWHDLPTTLPADLPIARRGRGAGMVRACALDDVLCTGELERRPRRAADPAAENRALVDLARRIAGPRRALLEALVEHAASLCGGDSAGISVLQQADGGDEFRWDAIVGPFAVHEGERVARDESPCGIVLDRDATLCFREPLRYFDAMTDAAGPSIVEALVAPIRAGDEIVGTLWVLTHGNERTFDAEDARVLDDLARFAEGATAGVARERRRGDVALRESEARHRFLADLADATRPLTSPDEVMALTARMLAEHIGADRCAYAEVEDESVFVITGDFTRDVPSIVGRWSVASFGSECERCMRADEPYVVEDVDADPRIGTADLPAYRATTIQAVICVPLHKAGKFSAAMAVHTTVPRQWSAGDIRLLREVVARCWEAIERARAARAVIERDERLGYAVRLSGIGFWYCDLPFDELEWDEHVKEHFWLPPDTRVTLDMFYERIHPGDRERTRAAIDASITGRIPFDIDYRTVDPVTDAVKWVRALGGTTYAADGTPLRFDGVTVDVTARKIDEERLAHALERERADARLLERTAAAALSIHAAQSVDGVLEGVADHARHIIGARHAETVLGAGESPAREHGSLTVPFVARTGASLGFVRLTDKIDGEFTETDEAVLVQLAHIGSVAIESARLYDELRHQDRRKDEFLATLAHELRNPLAPIRTGIEILKVAGVEQGHRALAVMERQVGHMVRLVDDLLDLSRITRAKVELKMERVDLHAVIESALETSRPLIEAAEHELALRVPAEPLVLLADPTRVAQVLANLFNNAAKYTPRGGRIWCTAMRDGDTAVVQVGDTGVGIPREHLARVFDMFVQVGPSIDRAQGGLGIGLTLARRLVEIHGGTIEANSEGVGRGTVFTVRLPLAAGVPVETRAGGDGVEGRTTQGLRVLVVDDNIDGAESLAMLLEIAGHTTHVVHTGPEALPAAREFHPDLIVLDIGLPGMNGYEIARAMRSTPQIANVLLVALTGWGSAEDRRKAHEAGFDHHWTKPVQASEVHAVIAELASRKRA
jgi:signal transduction histidine kinase/ActR/RegA family two-component response regulator/PAS domain-containing protein